MLCIVGIDPGRRRLALGTWMARIHSSTCHGILLKQDVRYIYEDVASILKGRSMLHAAEGKLLQGLKRPIVEIRLSSANKHSRPKRQGPMGCAWTDADARCRYRCAMCTKREEPEQRHASHDAALQRQTLLGQISPCQTCAGSREGRLCIKRLSRGQLPNPPGPHQSRPAPHRCPPLGSMSPPGEEQPSLISMAGQGKGPHPKQHPARLLRARTLPG